MSLEPINKKSIVNANEAIPDEELIHIITGIFQGLSDETRVKILYALKNHELCVRDLSILVGISESGISHQLSHLKELQLVKARRDGNVMYYSLSYTHLLGMLREAEEYADHIKQGIPDHPEAK
jgi:DNA-binding transcriptional ArsR family regulator